MLSTLKKQETLESHKKANNRLSTILSHISISSSLPSYINELNNITKLSISLIIPVGTYYIYCTLLGIKPPEILSFIIDIYSQSVGLYALQQMHIQLKENLGVSRTLTRSYQLLSFVGSGIYTASFIGSINSTMGKTNLLFNLINTITYGYLVYLTIVYNFEVPDPINSRTIRGSVHWKSLIGYIIVLTGTLFIWIRESQASILTGNRYSLLAMIGFILTSFGILRGGFKTATTSIPVISPFSAIVPLACITILNTLTKMPYFSSSPLIRTYIVGYIAVSYCLVMIAYLARKEEQKKNILPNNDKFELF